MEKYICIAYSGKNSKEQIDTLSSSCYDENVEDFVNKHRLQGNRVLIDFSVNGKVVRQVSNK